MANHRARGCLYHRGRHRRAEAVWERRQPWQPGGLPNVQSGPAATFSVIIRTSGDPHAIASIVIIVVRLRCGPGQTFVGRTYGRGHCFPVCSGCCEPPPSCSRSLRFLPYSWFLGSLYRFHSTLTADARNRDPGGCFPDRRATSGREGSACADLLGLALSFSLSRVLRGCFMSAAIELGFWRRHPVFLLGAGGYLRPRPGQLS